MSITNYGELKEAVAEYAKRRDLAARIPDFIRAVHIEVQEYTGLMDDLVSDSDSNGLLHYDPFVYLYGALAEAAIYLRDDGPLLAYVAKYQKKLKNLALTGEPVLYGQPNGPQP